MKEMNYCYVGKAKDYNLFKLLSQTMERKIKNENSKTRTGKSRKQTLNQIFLERGKNKCLILKKAENEIVIPLKEIVYISAEDKYTIFHTVETSYFDRVSLQECEEKLEKYAFYRIHRK